MIPLYYLAQKAFSQKMQQVPLSNQHETENKLPAIHLISYSLNRLPTKISTSNWNLSLLFSQITSRENPRKRSNTYLQRLFWMYWRCSHYCFQHSFCSYIPLLAIELMHNVIDSFLPVVLVQAGNLHFRCSSSVPFGPLYTPR